MTRFLNSIFLALFLSHLSLQDESLAIIPRIESPPTPSRYVPHNSTQNSFQVGLEGRSLLDSWLGARDGGCTDPGYSPCSNIYACCPTGGTCCSLGCCKAGQSCCGINHCADPGDTCCTLGTCPSGWGCCKPGTCYPLGGQCCATGDYCTAGNICVLWQGRQACCTDTHCTAHVDGGVTYSAFAPVGTGTNTNGGGFSLPVTTTSKPTKTTIAPTNAPVYEYYYYTITWYYLSWYWTYSSAPSFMSTTFTFSTFKDITVYTTISVYATGSLDAGNSFLSIDKTFTGSTPAAATAILNATTSSSSLSGSTSTSNLATGAATGSSSSSSGGSSSGTNNQGSMPSVGWLGAWTGIMVVMGYMSFIL